MPGYQMTPLEQKSYRLLHTEGEDALRAEIGGPAAHYLTERWINAKVLRLKWDGSGSYSLTTFKKYADA